MAGIRYKGQIFSGAAAFGTADHVAYDNTESGLTADNVQDALDEIVTSTIPNGFRLVRKSVNTGSFTIGANSGVTKTIPFTVDSGYSYFGILRVNATSATIVIGNTYVDGNSFSCTLMNIDSKSKNITVYVDYLISKG